MGQIKYAYEKTLSDTGFEQALERTEAALKKEGFGVITEIDVQATFKKKLDLDFRKYKILGACNPPIAKSVLDADLSLGLMLPCNVVVYEKNDGTQSVTIANPTEMFKIVDRPDLQEYAKEVDVRLQRVLEAL